MNKIHMLAVACSIAVVTIALAWASAGPARMQEYVSASNNESIDDNSETIDMLVEAMRAAKNRITILELRTGGYPSSIKEEARQVTWKEYEATAYTHRDAGCNLLTKTEFQLAPNARVVAVDPRFIPLGSIVEIEGFGKFYALDIGGAIKGSRIDIYFWDKGEALEFGRRRVKLRWREELAECK